LKAPGTQRLKPEEEKLLSNVALNFNLCRYGGVRMIKNGKDDADPSAAMVRRVNQVGRCRLTPGLPRLDRAWFQRLNLIHDAALLSFASKLCFQALLSSFGFKLWFQALLSRFGFKLCFQRLLSISTCAATTRQRTQTGCSTLS
jgi:hypothetical protein